MNLENKDESTGNSPDEQLTAAAPLGISETPPDPHVSHNRPPHRSSEGPGAQIGSYKILQQLGEGGFGTVFLAEQKTPFQRRVALKIIKLGMDTKEVIARFEAERQALAMMDHPNIAKVFDAGATSSGRPYFVMELVKGVPITKYCDTLNLSTNERLELFRQVCLAVQHAHQKGIIHRDLKPSNVLVTEQDGKPVPKVIDFGIAKATNGRLTDQTIHTDFNTILGTPEYMSPEQAELSALDIDTRSDIYALGVILYQLLTSTTPFGDKEFRTQGYDEMRRIIREVEPPRPSIRLHALGATLAAVAKQRQAEPKKLEESLRGELDWIVMKALEKNRARRYDTAQGLSLDVQRYLEDEPVLARPPTMGYRAGKFVRKHRGGVLAMIFVAAALVLGIVGTTIGMGRAKIAERVATERKNEVVSLLDQVKQAQAKAEQEAANARHHAGVAEDARKKSDAAAHAAQVALVQSHISEADALLQNGGRVQAEVLYESALKDGDALGLSPWPAKLGIFDAYRTVRPPIAAIDAGHKLRGAEFLPGDRQAISLSNDGWFEVWDLPSSRRIRVFPEAPDGKSNELFAISPDGAIAVNGETRNKNDAAIKFWNVATGKQIHEIAVKGESPASFSHDGKYFCVGGKDFTAYDVKTWAPAFHLTNGKGSDEGWKFLPEITPDDLFCVLGKYGEINLMELKTGRMVRATATPEFPQDAIAFSTTAPLGLIADSSGNLRRWEYLTSNPTADFADRHLGKISQVRISRDEKRAFTASWDGTVREWDVERLRSTRTLGFGVGRIRGFGISRDESLMVTASDSNTIATWSLQSAPWAAIVDDGRLACTGIGISKDMTAVATAYHGNLLQAWDVESKHSLAAVSINKDPSAFPSILHVSADGSFALSAFQNSKGEIQGLARSQVSSSGRENCLAAPEGRFECVLIPNDKCILTEDPGDHKLRLWDAGTFAEIEDKSPRWRELVDVETQSIINQTRRQNLDLPVAIASNGEFAAAAYGDSPRPNHGSNQLILVNPASDSSRVIIRPTSSIFGAAYLPDGGVIFVACGDGNIRAFDTSSGKLIRVLSGHSGAVQAIAISSDGNQMVSGGDDRAHRIWDFGAVDATRRFEPLQRQARTILQRDPEDAGSLKLLGDWYVLHGQWAWAAEMLAQAAAKGVAVSNTTLARCYWMNGDFDAAERAFAGSIRAKEASANYLTLCIAAVRQESTRSREWVARVETIQKLYDDGRDEEYFASMEAAVQDKPYDSGLYVKRQVAYGETGQFANAKADLETARRAGVGGIQERFRHACLAEYLGDRKGYANDCEALLPVADDANRSSASKAQKALLIIAGPVQDVCPAATAIDRQLKLPTEGVWDYLKMGMADFRLGKFDEAIGWLKKAETNDNLSAALTAQLFEAMCDFRAGRQDEARKLLAATIERIDRDLPKPGVQRITGGYENWLICQIIRREAEKTIK